MPLRASFPSTWHPHVDVWLLVAGLLIAYFWALRSVGPRHVEPFEFTATRRQKTWFVLGCAVIFIASDWPIHDLAERYLYSVHMVQHLLLTLVAVPLLLLGMPAWMWRAILRPRWLMSTARTLARPLVALIIFNGVLVFTHWPVVVTAAVHHHLLHFGIHVLLVFSAVVMWTPVLSPIIELPRLSYPGRMLYLFLQSLVPTIPASFLTFGDRPLYHVYESFPRLWGISAHTDQLVAGLIMKIAGGAILWGAIGVMFFRWFELEHREGVDVLEWRDVDRQLDRSAGLAKS
jgi:putative membrane protein